MKSSTRNFLSANTILWVRLFSSLTICLAAVVLSGWFLEIDSFTRLLTGLVSMKVNTALSLFLLSFVLFLQSIYPSPKIVLWLRRGALALVLTIGSLTFCEYVFSVNTGIDQFFFTYSEKEVMSSYPGRMSLLTTISCLLQAVSLLLIELGCAWNAVQLLTLTSIVIATLPLGGYLFGNVSFLYGKGTSHMALHTALGFLLIGIGILGITSVVGLFSTLKKHLPSISIITVLVLLTLVSMARIHGLQNDAKLIASLDKNYKTHALVDENTENVLDFNNQVMFFKLDSYDKEAHQKNIISLRNKLLTDIKNLKELTTDNTEQQDLISTLLLEFNEHFAIAEHLLHNKNWNDYNEFDKSNQKIILIFQKISKISREALNAKQDELILSKDASSMAVIFSMLLSVTLIAWVFNSLKMENVYSKKLMDALDTERHSLELRVEERTKDLIKKNIEIQNLNHSLEQKVEERTHQLQKMNDEFRGLNEALAKSIEKEMQSNREKDNILMQQSRFAVMGEMIGNIAHQWRQPLNALSLSVANIQDAYQYNELTEESLNEQVMLANKFIKTMSETIDDFRDFFKADHKLETFDALEAIQNSLNIVHATLKSKNINVAIDAPKPVVVMGFKGQYGQVILNILSNAKDALLERGITDGRIIITLEQEDNFAIVRIRDNAGGIPVDILEKIFDPYFTTRTQGTGIGLYMSKMIIENNMNGRLQVKNVEDGAEFEIKVRTG